MIEYGEAIGGPLELPYVAEDVDLVGRIVLAVPYYSHEEDEWYAFLEVKDKGLTRMRMQGVVSGVLLTSAPLRAEEDLCIPLADLMFQRLSFPSLARSLNGLFDVVENCASLLELYGIISRRYGDDEVGSQQLAQTLVNSLMVTCRTQYDVLHSMVRTACSMVRHSDDPSKRRIQDLPKRVSRAMLKDGVPKSADDLAKEYQMPPALAEYYSRQAPLLALIRDVRDRLAHRGRSVAKPGYVFCLDEGLAVSADRKPWSDFELWDTTSLAKNNLGSLRKVFVFLVSRILDAATEFGEAFGSCVPMPEPISPGNTLFLRSPLNKHLMDLDRILASPWERTGSDD